MLYLGFLHGLQFGRNRCREGGSNNRAMTLYIHDPGPQVPRFNASYARPCSIGLLSGCWSSSIKKKRIQTMSRQTKNNFLTNKAEIPKGKPVERNVTNNNPSSTNRLISLSLACVADVWKERGRGLGRLFTVPYFFVRSFRYTASYRHGYILIFKCTEGERGCRGL